MYQGYKYTSGPSDSQQALSIVLGIIFLTPSTLGWMLVLILLPFETSTGQRVIDFPAYLLIMITFGMVSSWRFALFQNRERLSTLSKGVVAGIVLGISAFVILYVRMGAPLPTASNGMELFLCGGGPAIYSLAMLAVMAGRDFKYRKGKGRFAIGDK